MLDLIAAVVTLVGLPITLLIFWPRMTVEAKAEINPADPHGIYMRITNTGFLQLRDVRPALGLRRLATGPLRQELPPLEPNAEGARIFPLFWAVKQISSDEQYEIRLDASAPKVNDGMFYFEPGTTLETLDFSLVVTYEPWIIPIRLEKEFRFATRRETNGMLSIMPRPLVK